MKGSFNFIHLEKVIFRNFSLYKKNGKIYEVNEDINTGVYCLAGANGLGKTTFLNALNYGLTGIVLEPDQQVHTPHDIVKANSAYTERYFRGRILKKDEDKAEIELIFKINQLYFRIIRGFFERDKLRLLEIYSKDGAKKISHFSNAKKSPSELNLHYQKEITTHVGFTSFEYFMFFQLYVLTFDENRRMIFWDEKASASALAVAFNSDPSDAERLVELNRLIDKHESNGRNARWQATQANNKIKALLADLEGKNSDDDENLEQEFQTLNKELEKAEKAYNQIKIEFEALLSRQSYINADIMQYKNEHTRLFSKYSKPRSKLLENTNVLLSLKKNECCVCGTHGTYVVDSIQKNIHKDKCPLCETQINEKNSAEQTRILQEIQKNDKLIKAKDDELKTLMLEASGKQNELEKAELIMEVIKYNIEDFTKDNPDFSLRFAGNNTTNSLLQQYQNQFILYDRQAKDEYAKRDKLKPEYEKVVKRVETSYKEGRTVFVPIFKKLAKSFIGLELDIELERSKKGPILVMSLQNTARTASFQLSESQRFFLDIALRMALANFLSNKQSPSTLFIDTPEGSLDIAYENRVGNMFAEFVMLYKQNLLMTANINASQLLLSLAEKCGKNNMKFRRMLDWTDLSQVQKEGEALFKKVYSNIENSLNKKPNGKASNA